MQIRALVISRSIVCMCINYAETIAPLELVENAATKWNFKYKKKREVCEEFKMTLCAYTSALTHYILDNHLTD